MKRWRSKVVERWWRARAGPECLLMPGPSTPVERGRAPEALSAGVRCGSRVSRFVIRNYPTAIARDCGNDCSRHGSTRSLSAATRDAGDRLRLRTDRRGTGAAARGGRGRRGRPFPCPPRKSTTTTRRYPESHLPGGRRPVTSRGRCGIRRRGHTHDALSCACTRAGAAGGLPRSAPRRLACRIRRRLRDDHVRAERFDSHGYVETAEPGYLLTVVDRGVDALVSPGIIGEELGAALKAEARRRAERGEFYGHIGYASLLARKPA